MSGRDPGQDPPGHVPLPRPVVLKPPVAFQRHLPALAVAQPRTFQRHLLARPDHVAVFTPPVEDPLRWAMHFPHGLVLIPPAGTLLDLLGDQRLHQPQPRLTGQLVDGGP